MPTNEDERLIESLAESRGPLDVIHEYDPYYMARAMARTQVEILARLDRIEDRISDTIGMGG